jgi:capsular polysaccharide biosynthesis protein
MDYVVSPNGTFGGTYKDEPALPQWNPFREIWRRLWMIVLIVIVCVGAAAAFSYSQTPTYKTNLKVLIGHEVLATTTYTEQEKEAYTATTDNQGEEGSLQTNTTETFTPPNLQTEIQGLQQLTKTMAEGVKTRPIAEAVVQRLEGQDSPTDLPTDWKTLLPNLEAKQVGETQFIDISYKGSSPEAAQLVANTVGDEFSEQVSELSPSSGSTTTATVWERAVLPEDTPAGPQTELNMFLALVLGLMLGVGLALLLGYLKDDWRSPEEAEQISGVPTLAAIPAFKARKLSKRGGN